MPRPSYAVELRVLGRALDAEDARIVEIREADDVLTVSWEDSAGEVHTTTYNADGDLQRLLAQARQLRGRSSSTPGQLEPLLRTLGQDLDREGLQLSRIRDLRGFEVNGVREGERVMHWYSLDELRTKNRERQTPRKAPGRGQRPWWRFWGPGGEQSPAAAPRSNGSPGVARARGG